MEKRIKNTLKYINAMLVDGNNQDLAVAAKNELRMALSEMEQHNKERQEKPLHEFDPTKKEEVSQ